MPLSPISKLFAVSDAKISKVTADPAGGTITYGTAIDVPGIKSCTVTGDITSAELRGDNTLLDSNSTLASIEVEFEYAKLNQDALAVMLGGTVTGTGTTPSQISTYRLLNTDTFSYFKFQAKTPTGGSDSVTGDAHIVLYKCILSEFPEFGMAEEDYETFSTSAKAIPTLATTSGGWMNVVFNETAAAI